MNANEKLFDDLCECFGGFEQFRAHPDKYEIEFVKLEKNICYFNVILKKFEGFNEKEINCFCYGPCDGTYYLNIEGNVTTAPPEIVYIRFRANSRAVVKSIFGYLSDGPSTTLSPGTLEHLLRDYKIEEKLIEEVMNTIHAQRNCSYNDGWTDAKELRKNKE